MIESDVISKLKSLKEVEPNENWVVSVRHEILTKAPYNDIARNAYAVKPTIMDNLAFIYDSISKKHRFVPSLATISVILLIGSFFTVTASKSSLPGDTLYSVKIANENMILAVSGNEGDKAKIEIQQAGLRLEELTEISKKSSDLAQQEKAEQLLANFEQKVNSAQTRMAKINESGEKKGVASLAKVINVQSEKYSDVLAKTSNNLPTVIQKKVSDKLASAISKTDKINTQSLLIIIETKDGNESAMSDVEIVEKLKKKLDEIGGSASQESNGNNANSTIIDRNAETKEVQKSASPPYSALQTKDTNGTAESTTFDGHTDSVQKPVDAKQTLIDSANESIQNNDILGAAKNIGEILAINEKTATDATAIKGITQTSDVASPTVDIAKTLETKEVPTDAVRLDFSPSINIVE